MPSGAIDDGFRVLVIKQCRETFGGVRERTYCTVPIPTQPLLLTSPPPQKLAREKNKQTTNDGCLVFRSQEVSIHFCLSVYRSDFRTGFV